MKWFLVLCLAIVASNADEGFQKNSYREKVQRYHELVGIPLANSIRKAEEAAVHNRSRIIGGQPAPLGAHPYLVGIIIHYANRHSACGSSMLSNTRAITAAHCWVDLGGQAESFTMVFGSEYLYIGGVRVDTRDVLVHSGWNPMSLQFEYDLAMIRFEHVAYSSVIQPISLPTGSLLSNDFAGYWAQLSGYGMIGDEVPITATQVQSHVTLQVLSNDVCRALMGWFITDKIICTNGIGSDGPVGGCSSDSGGPLSVTHDDQRVLIGVVSFGDGICESGQPSGFVRITEHMPWIQERL